MKIYNTLTNKKEEFVPHKKNLVRMYVCGPTVYDLIHIGNARPMIVFDSFRRYLEFLGYEVIYVSNFTDIDDKIIKKAIDTNSTQKEVSNKYIEECKMDMKNMNIKEATFTPYATDEIKDMILFISELIDLGFAYKVSDGTVYFDTSKVSDYGKLSKKNIDDLKSGFREITVTGSLSKKNYTDFVLWKPKKENEPYYDSPFCEGRPGWHTECCVMAPKYCGGALDIHAGGEDLIFPHHENEIAQFEAVFKEPFSKYWMHNAFLNINNEKMSKSLGNFFTVRDILNKFDGNIFRLFMLSTHYRVMLNFSFDLMESAKKSFERIENCILNIEFLIKKLGNRVENFYNDDELFENKLEFYEYINDVLSANSDLNSDEIDIINKIKNYVDIYFDKLDDDFNTADAITQIYEIVKIVNQTANEKSNLLFLLFCFEVIGTLLGILGIKISIKNNIDVEIESLIEERNIARKNKDFKRADEIRNLLIEQGIELEDTRQGVKWKRIK